LKVLIVETEKALAAALRDGFIAKGFLVELIMNGPVGYEYAMSGMYDFLVADTGVPGIDVYPMIRKVREKYAAMPILVLTQTWNSENRIAAMDAGADYCLEKYCPFREVYQCVHALLRRQNLQPEQFTFGDISLDPDTGILSCGDASVHLPAKEFDVLRFMIRNGGRNISKEVLLSRVWGADSSAVDNHVEVYAGFLRKRLRAIGSKVQIIAIRRQGYHLEMGEE